MSAGGDRDPRVKLMTLREYRKADGGTYYKGWLGDTIVLVFKDDRAEPDYGAEAVWSVFLTPKRPKPASDGGQGTTAAPSARRQTGRRESWQAPARTRSEPSSYDDPNDDLPF